MTDSTPSHTVQQRPERAGCSGAGGGVFSYAAGHLRGGTFFTDGLKVSFFYSQVESFARQGRGNTFFVSIR